MTWINTVDGSPIRLTLDPRASAPDVPGAVLASAPEGTSWWSGSGERWIATRGRGAQTELFVGGAQGWFDSGLRGVGAPVIDAAGRGLFNRGGWLWSLQVDGPRSTLAPLAYFDGLRAATGLGDRIAVLTGSNVLSVLAGDRVVATWSLGEGEFQQLRALRGGDLLMVTQTASHDGSPREGQVAHVLWMKGDAPRRVARLAPGPDSGEWDTWLSLDVQFVGPFDGAFAKGTKASPLPDDTACGEPGRFTIDGLDAVDASTPGECLAEAPEPLFTAEGRPEAPTMTAIEGGNAATRGELPPPRLGELGPRLRHLLTIIKLGERQAPLPEVLALLSIPMPADLYALIHTWAHYHVSTAPFDNIDWWLAPPRRDDRSAGKAAVGIRIGSMASGDPFVAQVFDSGTARFTNFDDEGCEYFTSRSLEGLLDTLVREQHARGNTTIFDALA